MYKAEIGYKKNFFLTKPKLLFYWIRFIDKIIFWSISLLIIIVSLGVSWIVIRDYGENIFYIKQILELFLFFLLPFYFFIIPFAFSFNIKKYSLFRIPGDKDINFYILLPNGLFRLASVTILFSLFADYEINYIDNKFISYFKHIKTIELCDPIRQKDGRSCFACYRIIDNKYYYGIRNEEMLKLIYPDKVNEDGSIVWNFEISDEEFIKEQENMIRELNNDIFYYKENLKKWQEIEKKK